MYFSSWQKVLIFVNVRWHLDKNWRCAIKDKVKDKELQYAV